MGTWGRAMSDDEKPATSYRRWRLARAATVGLLIGLVVIVFSHLAH